MSDARIAQLEQEIEHQQQRQKDFSAYPESVEAAKRAEQAASDELAKLRGEESSEPKKRGAKRAEQAASDDSEQD